MPARNQSCGCSRGPNVEHGKWYGVRSYLHLFYEDCTGAGLADDVTEYPVSRAHGGWPSLVWKVRTMSASLAPAGRSSLTCPAQAPGLPQITPV
uniref:NRSN2 n=1 Tax=Gopherus evgoodei TaxID=1825980 RepID=A0A8C4W4Q2_9SAUR